MELHPSLSYSASQSNSKNASDHVRFNIKSAEDVESLARAACAEIWSPCIWRGGYRKACNFTGCSLGVLDFDSGHPTLSEICRIVSGVRHIVITTKSHQIAKISGARIIPPSDRYRIIFPLARAMAAEKDRYKWQMFWLHKRFPGADRSCIDQARFYWPGKEVISVKSSGEFVDLPDAPSIDELKKNLERSIKRERSRISMGIVPQWLRGFLEVGAPIGERRRMIFKSAATLARCGYEFNETINMINSSPFERTDIDYDEFERHVKNGWEAGKKR